jgi:hypothetical protein
MSKSYIIEVRQAANSATAGLVIQERGGFRFFAAGQAFTSLDGCLFRSPSEAEKVATRIVNAGAKPARPHGRSGAPALAQSQHPHLQHVEGGGHVEH